MRSTVEVKDLPDAFGFVGHDDKFGFFDRESEDRHATAPFTFATSGRDLVSGAFADHLAFETVRTREAH